MRARGSAAALAVEASFVHSCLQVSQYRFFLCFTKMSGSASLPDFSEVPIFLREEERRLGRPVSDEVFRGLPGREGAWHHIMNWIAQRRRDFTRMMIPEVYDYTRQIRMGLYRWSPYHATGGWWVGVAYGGGHLPGAIGDVLSTRKRIKSNVNRYAGYRGSGGRIRYD